MYRIGCESDLIVHDNVDSASNAKVGNSCHLHGFVYNTLTGKCRISVQQNGNDIANILRTALFMSREQA